MKQSTSMILNGKHSLAKLTKKSRKDIYYRRTVEKQKITDIADYYHVHRNTITKVIKLWKINIFDVRKSTKHIYIWLWSGLKKLDKIQEKIIKIQERLNWIIRYEKDYAWELVHIDCHKIKNIKWQNPNKKKYLVSIIDDATRITFTKIIHNKKAQTLSNFLNEWYVWFKKRWIIIQKILSDNWKEFTTHRINQRSKHKFEKMCIKLNIIHKYTKIFRPQTNGKVERFRRILNDNILKIYIFKDRKDLSIKLYDWLYYYNHHRPHWWIKYMTPMEKYKKIELEKWILVMQ